MAPHPYCERPLTCAIPIRSTPIQQGLQLQITGWFGRQWWRAQSWIWWFCLTCVMAQKAEVLNPLIGIVWIQLRLLMGVRMLSEGLKSAHLGQHLSRHDEALDDHSRGLPSNPHILAVSVFCNTRRFAQSLEHLHYLLSHLLNVLGFWKSVSPHQATH